MPGLVTNYPARNTPVVLYIYCVHYPLHGLLYLNIYAMCLTRVLTHTCLSWKEKVGIVSSFELLLTEGETGCEKSLSTLM